MITLFIIDTDDKIKIKYIPIDKNVKMFYKMQKIAFKDKHKSFFKTQNDLLSPIKKDTTNIKNTLINHCKLWIWLGNYFFESDKHFSCSIKKYYFNHFKYKKYVEKDCFLCYYSKTKNRYGDFSDYNYYGDFSDYNYCICCPVEWKCFNRKKALLCVKSYYNLLYSNISKKKKILLCYQIAFLVLNKNKTECNITIKDVLKNYN